MKTLILIITLLMALPLLAETYSDTEFIVPGEAPRPTTVMAQPAPAGTTVVTTQPGSTVVTTTSPAPTESPIYVGMSKQHVMEVMGRPTNVEKFKKFSARQQGIYDEIWTYQGPASVTYVYIKERRVDKIEYR
jgi:hypothetical protein